MTRKARRNKKALFGPFGTVSFSLRENTTP